MNIVVISVENKHKKVVVVDYSQNPKSKKATTEGAAAARRVLTHRKLLSAERQ